MIVKIVSAIGGEVLEFDVSPDTEIEKLKSQVAKKKRVPESTLILVYRGQQLENNTTLEKAGIQAYDKLYLVTRTEGG
ncbi:MAG: ubiquitin-like domain-containing protein [Candidatus Jordarchaeum sp.]|uniref:ubiquitin-like domain-containing protein n=1 Tax=Candidatus Jordarchaeum sp. TaxID=2823881 RepID=UPI00404B3D82